jgi:hypothetical protein
LKYINYANNFGEKVSFFSQQRTVWKPEIRESAKKSIRHWSAQPWA